MTRARTETMHFKRVVANLIRAWITAVRLWQDVLAVAPDDDAIRMRLANAWAGLAGALVLYRELRWD